MDTEQHELFTRLWTATQGAVAAYVHATIRNPAKADDVIQEVAVTATRKFDTFDQDRSFTAWVMGIARFQVLHAMRGLARDRHVLTAELAETLADEAVALADTFERERHYLHTCLEQVAGRSREVLRCRYERGMDAKSIGERLSMKASAVRTLLHRVRAQLEQCIRARLAGGGQR